MIRNIASGGAGPTGPPARTAGSDASAAAAGRPRRTTTAALLGDARELVIEHAGEAYRLRVTSKGKLILTK
ncbi:hemin uptake protein HemP [Anaeromyxobacter dehalogenans]|uniref:hemin uptake protein HemP n=1 Tax=Anaeromyxobacter dehalogenans TaxID=161493 RepID=UPI00030D36D4|nr:hemin uptake protein HemP [Anaeromyxobacter dehalogenans]